MITLIAHEIAGAEREQAARERCVEPAHSSSTSTRPTRINPAAGHCQPRNRSGKNGQPNTMTQNGIV